MLRKFFIATAVLSCASVGFADTPVTYNCSVAITIPSTFTQTGYPDVIALLNLPTVTIQTITQPTHFPIMGTITEKNDAPHLDGKYTCTINPSPAATIGRGLAKQVESGANSER